jgi:hypothetical protein
MRGLDTYTVIHMDSSPKVVSVDLAVITDTKLSDEAKTLYTYLLGINNSIGSEDEHIISALGLTEVDYITRKKELEAADLLLYEKDEIKGDAMYIGNSTEKASESRSKREALLNSITN